MHTRMPHPLPAWPPAAGDELRLRHPCPNAGCPPWVGVGFVARLDDASEEVALEFRAKERGQGPPPTDVTTGFVGECSGQRAVSSEQGWLVRGCCCAAH
jgi:hypothetical protein